MELQLKNLYLHGKFLSNHDPNNDPNNEIVNIIYVYVLLFSYRDGYKTKIFKLIKVHYVNSVMWLKAAGRLTHSYKRN